MNPVSYYKHIYNEHTHRFINVSTNKNIIDGVGTFDILVMSEIRQKFYYVKTQKSEEIFSQDKYIGKFIRACLRRGVLLFCWILGLINICTSNASRDTCVCGNYFVAWRLFVMQFGSPTKARSARPTGTRIGNIFN